MSSRRRVAQAPACRAPFVSMRLAPNGQVYVCGPNWTRSLGNVAYSGLKEMWNGKQAVELRDALAAGDFSLGCDECAIDAMGPLRSTTHAATYDSYPLDATEWPRRIEFALSNTCNLQCVQCSGELSSAIRTQREGRAPLRSPYDESFFEELADFLPHVELAAFVGGEPFLGRETRRVWDMLIERGLQPTVQVTTNATVWNDRVEQYLEALRMDVTLSIDGVSAATNDTIRVGAQIDVMRGVRDRVIEVTRRYGGSVCVNHCLMRQNWYELPELLVECEQLGLPVYVCRVLHPSSYSLFAMEPGELAPVVAGLGRHDAEMQASLDVNLDVWDRTLAMLTAHLEAAAAPATSVHLPARDATRPDGRIRAISTELGAWSGRVPLHLQAVDGRVTAADVPDWGPGVDLDGWVGLDLTELLPRFEALLGAALSPPSTSDIDGVQVLSLRTIDDRVGAVELRAGLVPWTGGSRPHLEVVVSALGALPAGHRSSTS